MAAVDEALEVLGRGVEEILLREELREKLKAGKPLRVKASSSSSLFLSEISFSLSSLIFFILSIAIIVPLSSLPSSLPLSFFLLQLPFSLPSLP